MEPNKSLFNVMKSDAQKVKIIINNVLIMLGNRIYIDNQGEKQPLINVEETRKKIDNHGDGVFTLKANNGDNYAIKIIFSRISAIGKQSVVSEFFKEYPKHKKIIIARDFNNKMLDHVSKQHRTQIFKELQLLENIIEHIDQPRFELLSPKEMELVKKEYSATDYTLKKLNRNDPIAKYFALQKGDIIRILRPSPTSGWAIDYRIVV